MPLWNDQGHNLAAAEDRISNLAGTGIHDLAGAGIWVGLEPPILAGSGIGWPGTKLKYF